MLLQVSNKKQRSLLNAQLVDEKHHAKIFTEGVSRIGLDERASRYADGYADLVKEQKSFSEKVFVFQILTEAISAAYCCWRLVNIKEVSLNKIDLEVAEDEKRHLIMGKTLLSICDQEEIKSMLTLGRQKELITAMNELCEKTVRKDMMQTLTGSNLDKPTSLDRYIAKSVIQEFRNIKQVLNMRAIDI
jgi:rubrerythrin